MKYKAYPVSLSLPMSESLCKKVSDEGMWESIVCYNKFTGRDIFYSYNFGDMSMGFGFGILFTFLLVWLYILSNR